MTGLFKRLCIILIIAFAFLTQPCGAAQATYPDEAKPTAPANLAVTGRTYTSVSINWSKSSDNKGVKGYRIYRDGIKVISAAETECTVKDLIPGKKYALIVRAYDAAGNLSDNSSALQVETVQDTQLPTAPYNLNGVSATYTTITLKWNPSSDNTKVKGYEIYCNSKKKASSTTAYYICKGLEPGKIYDFFVKSYDIAGNYSAASSTIHFASTPDRSAPSVPEGLELVSSAETEINLLWSPSSDNVKVRKYELYCDGVRKVSTSKTTYSFKGLIPGKSYIITLKALDSTGNCSVLSKPLKVTTVKDLKAPDAPIGLKVKSIKGSSVALEWTASTDNVKVKGYKIYCNGLEISTSTRPSRSVQVPKGIGINIISVKAYDLVGNTSPASKSVMIIG